MGKVKPKRSAPSVDMTAMVDVAFLLLTFFILTTQFKAEEKVTVDTPSSTGNIEINPSEIYMITVSEDGKVFFAIPVQQDRENALNRVRSRYGNFGVTEDGMKYWINQASFGVPINQMEAWLALPPEDRKDYEQPGIPVLGPTNELKEWVQAARRINPGRPFAIKADGNTEYPVMDKVIATLQDVKVNKFNLVTNLEKDDEGGAEGGGE